MSVSNDRKWAVAALSLLALALLLGWPPTAHAEVNLSAPPPLGGATADSPIMAYPEEEEGSEAAEPTSTESESPQARFESYGVPLPFEGGYVQHRPHVYLIFWGSAWSQGGEPAQARENLLNLYRWLPNSPYAKILTQYFDFNGYISPETDLTSMTDARALPPTVDVAAIKNEVHWAIQNQPGWQNVNYENQYVVVAPPNANVNVGVGMGGTTPCAFHGWDGAPWQLTFTFINWTPTRCLRELPPKFAMQVSASHEWAETATDPIPVGEYIGWMWSNVEGEIADICNIGTPSEHVQVASGIYVAKLADNYLYKANGTPCVVQDIGPTGTGPVRYSVATGASAVGLHTATLTGSVGPAGWPGGYQFEFSGPGGTQILPATFAGLAGGLFGNVPVSAAVSGLKGNTTYTVRLKSYSQMTEPLVTRPIGAKIVFSGGDSQFTTPDWRPKVSSVSAVPGSHSVSLSGTIDGQGEGTSYRFEYGPTTAYGTNIPVPNGATPASAANVSQKVNGSEEFEGTYHYRLVASNAEGTTFGPDQTFYVQERPTITAEDPAEVTGTGGKLAARIDPKGVATTYLFEYGMTAGYGSKSTSASAGSGSAATAVTTTVSGLEFGTAYHYRVVAENSAGKRIGPDQTFTPGIKLEPVPAMAGSTSTGLEAVSCSSATTCAAVGRREVPNVGTMPFAARWDGSSWTNEAAPSLPGHGSRLRGVSCVSASNCKAVGTYEDNTTGQIWPMVDSWNGSSWSVAAMPVAPNAQGATYPLSISCPATSFCIAAGQQWVPGATQIPIHPYLAKSNGSSWTEVTVPEPVGALYSALVSVSCVSATDCWAAGNSVYSATDIREFAEHWDGTQWTQQALPRLAGVNENALLSVSCGSASLCVAAGAYKNSSNKRVPYAERWDGSKWQVEALPAPGPSSVNNWVEGVACAGSSCEIAGGSEGPEPFALRLKGGVWNVQKVPTPAGWGKPEFPSNHRGIACAAEGECMSVGNLAPTAQPFSVRISKTLGTASPPTAAWAFDEGTGSSAKDAVTAHNATLTSTSWVEGKYGKALSFNGSSSCATVPNSSDLQLTGPFSLEAWVKPNNTTQWSPIFFKEGSEFYGYSLFFGAFKSGYVQGYTASKTNEYSEVESTEKLVANTWAHVAMTSDGTTLRLYVNGKQVDTGEAGPVMATSGPLQIGCAKLWGEYFNGTIDNARVYNRTLSPGEVEANKAVAVSPPAPPPPGAPTAAFAFNEGAGTAVNDSAGSHNGTVAFPAWVEGKYGKAIKFDGEGTCVSVPNSSDLQLSGSFTIEAEVKPANTTQEFGPIFFKESETFYGYSLFFGAFEAGHLQGYIADTPWEGWSEVESPEKLVANVWSHVAMTSDGTTLRLYVNGKQVDSGASQAAMESKGPLLIGCAKSMGAEYFNGSIDNARIYNRALSQAEIEADRGAGI